MVTFLINIKRLIFILCAIFIFLLFANILANILFVNADKPLNGFIFYFYKTFDFDDEKNIPTYFSVILLFLASQTFFIIRQKLIHTTISSYMKYYWLQMAFIFLLLSIDELIRIHERLEYISIYFISSEMTGFFKFVWVIPMIGLLCCFGLYSIKFLMNIHKSLRNGYIISGFIYVFGALGMEMLSAKLHIEGQEGFGYYVTMTIEESLEMIGIIVLLYFNLGYINELSTETVRQPK